MQKGIWVAMDKVGFRIMRLWNDCQFPKANVILLISVNGMKSYCGLAEMTGPWAPGCEQDDAVDIQDGSRTYGYISSNNLL